MKVNTAKNMKNEVVLRTERVSRTYPMGDETVHALIDVTFEVRRGEFVAVMGPSGSGKSTLLHLLGLVDRPDAGDVFVEGRSTKSLDDDQATLLRRDRLGFVFQSFELLPSLNARENILLPADIAGRRRAAETRLEPLARQLGLQERLTHRPSELSGGQRQRVALARALINEPAVILADEPTGNLDTRTGDEVLALLRAGVDTHGWTVVLVTHDRHAAGYADRVVTLQDGRVVSDELISDEPVNDEAVSDETVDDEPAAGRSGSRQEARAS